MIHRISLLTVTAIIAAALYYGSRFWEFRLWGRPGLFGWDQLPPQGGLVGRWLRGTDFAPFELLIWAVAAFLILTWLEKLFSRIPGPKDKD